MRQQYEIYPNPCFKVVSSAVVDWTRPDGEEIISPVEFIKVEIRASIVRLAENSATGSGRMPSWLLKSYNDSIARPLIKLWQKSLDEGHVLRCLRARVVSPVWKGEESEIVETNARQCLPPILLKYFRNWKQTG